LEEMVEFVVGDMAGGGGERVFLLKN